MFFFLKHLRSCLNFWHLAGKSWKLGKTYIAIVVASNISNFHGEMKWLNLTIYYFSTGLVQPPPRIRMVFCLQKTYWKPSPAHEKPSPTAPMSGGQRGTQVPWQLVGPKTGPEGPCEGTVWICMVWNNNYWQNTQIFLKSISTASDYLELTLWWIIFLTIVDDHWGSCAGLNFEAGMYSDSFLGINIAAFSDAFDVFVNRHSLCFSSFPEFSTKKLTGFDGFCMVKTPWVGWLVGWLVVFFVIPQLVVGWPPSSLKATSKL